MKARRDLSATDLAELYEELERKLGDIGVETQPGVAMRILDLSQDPDAGMQDYAKIIRNDPGLTGRLIRLSNSAFFAQRKPVTSIDRACVLLGMSRLRSIALGFYLSKASCTDPGAQISREIWGQSVYRACLAAELARQVMPAVAPEAFVIGLMLDAGVPLAHKLLGAPFEVLYAQGLSPHRGFAAEFEHHPYTHVDIISVMLRRWNFPETLAKPVLWHHTPPPPTTAGAQDPVQVLYRIAYYTGAVELGPDGQPTKKQMDIGEGKCHLGLDAARLEKVAATSSDEYGSVLELFSDVADPVAAANLSGRVHQQLVDVLDRQMAASLGGEGEVGPQHFRLGGLTVTVRAEDEVAGTAYCYDSNGEPISSYRFLLAADTPDSIRNALGLEPEETDEIDQLGEYLHRLAAA